MFSIAHRLQCLQCRRSMSWTSGIPGKVWAALLCSRNVGVAGAARAMVGGVNIAPTWIEGESTSLSKETRGGEEQAKEPMTNKSITRKLTTKYAFLCVHYRFTPQSNFSCPASLYKISDTWWHMAHTVEPEAEGLLWTRTLWVLRTLPMFRFIRTLGNCRMVHTSTASLVAAWDFFSGMELLMEPIFGAVKTRLHRVRLGTWRPTRWFAASIWHTLDRHVGSSFWFVWFVLQLLQGKFTGHWGLSHQRCFSAGLGTRGMLGCFRLCTFPCSSLS